MPDRSLPTEEEIVDELKGQADDYDSVPEDLVIKLYNLEKQYSTMERRRGITTDIRQAIEDHADTDEI
jgi:hypothetical protein